MVDRYSWMKHIQTKKERGHILSAKTVSRWSYQEMSAKLWNLQCNHNALVIGPSHPLDPRNLVKWTFAHPQLFPSEGINKSSTRTSWRNKGKMMNFKPLCFSKPGHICFQDLERRVPTFPANALGQQREIYDFNYLGGWWTCKGINSLRCGNLRHTDTRKFQGNSTLGFPNPSVVELPDLKAQKPLVGQVTSLQKQPELDWFWVARLKLNFKSRRWCLI